MSKLTELLNSRHQDLDFELGTLHSLYQLANNVAKKLDVEAEANTVLTAMQNRLMDKLNVDIEDIAEDEEIDVEDLDFAVIYDHLGTAFFHAKTEMASYLQFDSTLNNLKRLGATDDEVEKLQGFKKRLERTIFDRYDVTEDDLKEDGDE